MGGTAENLGLPAIRPGSPDGDVTRRATIYVEADLRVPQVCQVHKASPPQTALLTHREQKGKRRVRERFFKQGGQDRHQAGDPCAIIASKCRLALGHDALPPAHRHGTGAQGHRIEVSHEETARPLDRAGKLNNEVAGLRRQGNL